MRKTFSTYRILVIFLSLFHIFQTARSQGVSIPDDLKKNFTQDLRVQVAYNGIITDGFNSGYQFTVEETAKAPGLITLGNSTGGNATQKYASILVDVSCDKNRTIHYFQIDFQINSSVNGQDLSSNSTPLINHVGPGGFGENGVRRAYAFLLYEIELKKDWWVPDWGQPIRIAEFQEANDLQDPVAGVAFNVNIGKNFTSCLNLPGPDNSTAPKSTNSASSLSQATPRPSASNSVKQTTIATTATLSSTVDMWWWIKNGTATQITADPSYTGITTTLLWPAKESSTPMPTTDQVIPAFTAFAPAPTSSTSDAACRWSFSAGAAKRILFVAFVPVLVVALLQYSLARL